LAEAKLLNTVRGGFSPKNVAQVLAVFSHRVLLEIGVGEASTMHVVEAVKSHMRILLGVTDRSIVHTRAPSEPMLSVAACNILNDNQATYKDAVETLVELLTVQNVIIDRGRQGELFARLLLTLARDEATCRFRGVPRLYLSNGGTARVRTTTVSAFLEALLGKKRMDAQPDLRKDTENMHINFTHFYPLEESLSDITSDWLRRAWERGVAFQCSSNQHVIDLVIPKYAGDLDAPWDYAKLGTICVQIKNRRDPVKADLLDQLVGPTIDGERRENEVVILMDLGTDRAFQRIGGHHSFAYDTVNTPKEVNWGGYRPKVERKRWCIAIRGCNAEQYPVLEPFMPHMLELTLPYEHKIFENASVAFEKQMKVGLDSQTSPE
jgi:hypothetical protein